MKIVAVIPCLNEQSFIGDVVVKTLKYVDRVVVVDDCSVDNTAEIARQNGAVVFQNERRRGFGGNLMFGIRKVIASGEEDIIVTLDGDGQHNPSDIPNLVEPIKRNKAEIVIGSRFLKDYQCPVYRKVGIDIINWFYNVGCKEKITDSQCCLRAYWRGVFSGIKFEDNNFGFSTEILIKTRRRGFRIVEVPVECIYHDKFSLNSTINPIKHGISVVSSTLMWRIKR